VSARETILAALRANRPAGEHGLPDLPDFALDDGGDRIGLFSRMLERMGGRRHAGPADTALAALFPDARVIASTVPEVAGNRDVGAVAHPRDLADVDVAVVRAAFAVAETGSVLLVDDGLVTNAVAYLAQHLLVLVDPADVLLTMQAAYRRPEFAHHRYCAFHTGPSATADIQGVLIHGAQGVRSLTVIMAPRA